MAITRLSLTDFRSYADLVVDVAVDGAVEGTPGLVVLTGDNGAGKTNILEAVSLLAPGRGLRGVALRDMARASGAGGFSINARLTGIEAGGIDLGTGTVSIAPDRRIARANGANVAVSSLAEWLSLVWLTPAQDRLFVDTAGARRRFLDRLVLALAPEHARDATRYDAAMRQRNRLLAEGSSGHRPDPEWLAALEAAMVEHGTALAARRARLVDALSARLAAAPPGPFARGHLAIEGWLADDDYTRSLATGRARDAAAGRALVGPHRQDLAVAHLDKQVAAAKASTGEQKALLIGIVLAHADLVADVQARRPVLLLDEVAAHLDGRRRDALFTRLADAGGQAWLSGTDPSTFAGIGSAVHLHVADRAIRYD